MFYPTRATIENVSPAKAKMWLDENYNHNRPVRPLRVDFYAEEMLRGKWQPTNPIAFAYVPQRKERILINGQHTLHAVLKANQTLKSYPILQYTVERDGEIADLYAHFDIGSTRSYSDSLEAYGIPDKTGLTKTNLNKLSSGIKWMLKGFPKAGSPDKRELMSHDDLIDHLYNWLDEFKLLERTISPCQNSIRNKIFLRSVLPIGLLTLRHQEEQAIRFWRQVAQTDMLPKNDPRLALNKALIKMGQSGGGANPHPNAYRPGDFSRVVAYSWNKFFRGATIAYIKPAIATKVDPIKIVGTPFNGETNPH